MRHLFIMDPVEGIQIHLDSTFALMCEAQARGHEVLYALIHDLYQRDGKACCLVRPTTLAKVQGQHAVLGAPTDLALAEVDVVWMRKDPPFDMDYIFCTYLLDVAAKEALVVNHPEGLRSFNEKAFCLHYPDLVPDNVVTESMPRLRAFVEELGIAVIKPLDGNGGEGVFVVRQDDPNIGVILEVSTRHGRRKVMAQRYLPEAKLGDKRIILVDGEAVGACLRVPTGVDHRGNIHVGANVQPTKLTHRDQEICDAIGPRLRDAGQVFVGIDVIGDQLTEVNVTSPTCIHEINAFDGVKIEGMIHDAVESRLSAG